MINILATAQLMLFAGCEGAGADGGDELQGVVELDERVLGFQVGGRITRVLVEEGDHFEADAELAALDDSLDRTMREGQAAEARAARAQSDLVRAGARPEDVRAMAADVRGADEAEKLLSRSLDRQRVLASNGVSTAARTEELELQLAQARERRAGLAQRWRAVKAGARVEEIAAAEARAAAAEAALRATDERLGLFTLRAKDAGDVLEVHAERGEVVSPGAPVVTVADVDHPYADVFVPQDRLRGIAVGTTGHLRVDSERRPFSGRVEWIARRTEYSPRYLFSDRERPGLVVRVRVRIDDPRHLLHAGVPAFVTFGRRK
jgi:HlyD family secretion protein